MAQLTEHADFASEARGGLFVLQAAGRQDLQGHQAVQSAVPRLVDGPHAPRAQLFEQLVVAQLSRDFRRRGHCGGWAGGVRQQPLGPRQRGLQVRLVGELVRLGRTAQQAQQRVLPVIEVRQRILAVDTRVDVAGHLQGDLVAHVTDEVGQQFFAVRTAGLAHGALRTQPAMELAWLSIAVQVKSMTSPIPTPRLHGSGEPCYVVSTRNIDDSPSTCRLRRLPNIKNTTF